MEFCGTSVDDYWFGVDENMTSEVIADIKKLCLKIASGRRDWTLEELQLQNNYPEEVEKELNKLKEKMNERRH